MNYDYIDTDEGLGEFCDAIAGVPSIALDTEFVSEDRYFPELCLVQVAAGERHAVIDSLAIAHLDPFWRLVATPGRTVIVHAGREEHRFCRRAVGQGLATWFDTQIASGLIGLEYPASYATLIQKLLGKSLGKGETRTDWRRRPLSARQLEYALQDVVYLEPLHGEISSRLKTLDRDAWLAAELAAYQDRWEQEETAERWRRVAGISGLTARQLAVL
ncbi:MAG: ribonuclease D, partial [Planctomycetes bacterium]|nr:ribonuclease D [Planctomycetota bacterium]